MSASGREEPLSFYTIQNCDAFGRPYLELKAGRGTFSFFVPSEVSSLHWLSFNFTFKIRYQTTSQKSRNMKAKSITQNLFRNDLSLT